MDTTNINILKSFYQGNNNDKLTREVYDYLLQRWGLDKLDLDAENLKINSKTSNLTRSGRLAVPEFIILRDTLKRKEEAANNSVSLNDATNATSEDVIVGQDFSNENIEIPTMQENASVSENIETVNAEVVQ